jgi:hypothetical protein
MCFKLSETTKSITHFLFADDLLIFAKATSFEARTIQSYLTSDCAWSGQQVNVAKSYLLFSKNALASTICSSVFFLSWPSFVYWEIK